VEESRRQLERDIKEERGGGTGTALLRLFLSVRTL